MVRNYCDDSHLNDDCSVSDGYEIWRGERHALSPCSNTDPLDLPRCDLPCSRKNAGDVRYKVSYPI